MSDHSHNLAYNKYSHYKLYDQQLVIKRPVNNKTSRHCTDIIITFR